MPEKIQNKSDVRANACPEKDNCIHNRDCILGDMFDKCYLFKQLKQKSEEKKQLMKSVTKINEKG